MAGFRRRSAGRSYGGQGGLRISECGIAPQAKCYTSMSGAGGLLAFAENGGGVKDVEGNQVQAGAGGAEGGLLHLAGHAGGGLGGVILDSADAGFGREHDDEEEVVIHVADEEADLAALLIDVGEAGF